MVHLLAAAAAAAAVLARVGEHHHHALRLCCLAASQSPAARQLSPCPLVLLSPCCSVLAQLSQLLLFSLLERCFLQGVATDAGTSFVAAA